MAAASTTARPTPVNDPTFAADPDQMTVGELHATFLDLRRQVDGMQQLLRKSEDRRRAMLHIMVDMNEANRRLSEQRKAMLHILGDYEADRRELARQTGGLRDTRRALLHILQDSHHATKRLERSRTAMIHIMGDLRDTTVAMQRREQELREKQEQLVQAAKLATLGELTTGVAHELNNPLNNIGLFVGNVIDLIQLGRLDKEPLLSQLRSAMQQVQKATEIITHLRTFGRAAPVSRDPLSINAVIEQSLALMREQLRLRSITVELDLAAENPPVIGNAIRLEQVFMNLLTNARDALDGVASKRIQISSRVDGDRVKLAFRDTGPGIPPGLEERIFDPFFTTKEVGAGTGLGLSITYGIVKDHDGAITVENRPGEGVAFLIELPLAEADGALRTAT
jgi:C4-dicarboxylate-specific signal transduction histidine kinase